VIQGAHPATSSFVRALLGTSTTQFALVALAFVSSVVQARLLGADGRGDIARFVNASGFVVLLFGLGLPSAVTYLLASGRASLKRLSVGVGHVFALTVALVAAVTAVALATALRDVLPHALAAPGTVVILAVFFAFSQLANLLAAVHAADRAFGVVNRSMVLAGATSAIVSIALLVSRPAWVDAGSIMIVLTTVEGVRCLSLLPALRRRIVTPTENALDVNKSGVGSLRGFWRYSGLSYVADLMQFLTYRFDIWVLSLTWPSGDLGRYALAVSLAQLVWVVPTAVARVVFSYSASSDTIAPAYLAWRGGLAALAIAAMAGTIGWIGSHPVVPWLFGKDFEGVPSLLGWLLLGTVPYSIARVLGNHLAGVGAMSENVAAAAFVMVIAIGLDLLLIPAFGAIGAAWATAIAYSLFAAIVIAVFLRRSPDIGRLGREPRA